MSYPITFTSDAELLGYCGCMEDRRGIGFAYGVMHVVMNRVASPEFPSTIHSVIFQTNAFSWTRSDNPEYGLQLSGPIYETAVQIAPMVIARDSDPTKGALWYANLKTATPGGWFERNITAQPEKHPILVQIGQHTFFA